MKGKCIKLLVSFSPLSHTLFGSSTSSVIGEKWRFYSFFKYLVEYTFCQSFKKCESDAFFQALKRRRDRWLWNIKTRKAQTTINFLTGDV